MGQKTLGMLYFLYGEDWQLTILKVLIIFAKKYIQLSEYNFFYIDTIYNTFYIKYDLNKI